MRPTIQAKPPEPADEDEGDEADQEQEQGRGESPAPKPTRRRRRPAPSGETRGRKLHLPDEIHDRLWLMARQKRTTVSAVATDLLDKALPRFRVEREG